MQYRYKPTTNGRAAMAAYMALEKPFHITRVAFGSGLVDKDVNLADVHQLVSYVSDGAAGERRHENDRFYFTIQYANSEHKEVKTFLLTEFIVYVEDPENGGETDLLYGTLGDYRQPVPAYDPAFPPSVFNFPLVMVLSDEVNVIVSAPAGLVTYTEFTTVIEQQKTSVQKLLDEHNSDPNAHGNGRHVIAVRERDPSKPDYGLSDNGGTAVLKVETYTGTAEVSAVVSGVKYDVENMRVGGENVPDGTLILERLGE